MDDPGASRRALLADACLYLVTPLRPGARPLVEVVDAALAAGVRVVQVRDKDAADADVVAAGRALRAACDRHGALLIVNDRPDLALACGADGVHVGQDDEPFAAVRALVGRELLVGVSTHSPDQIAAALATDADYLGVGPVYETATKPGRAPVGLDLVSYAAAAVERPFFAIGGIDRERAGAVVAAGARRIAVVRAICDAADPGAAAQELSETVEGVAVGGPAH